jgi:hypothetical protein
MASSAGDFDMEVWMALCRLLGLGLGNFLPKRMTDARGSTALGRYLNQKNQMPIILLILNAFILATAFVVVQAIYRSLGFGVLLLLGMSLPILALLLGSLPRLVLLSRTLL